MTTPITTPITTPMTTPITTPMTTPMTSLATYLRPTYLAAIAILASASLMAQSGKLSDADFQKAAASHANAAEHERLVAHYNAHAVEHEGDAKVHDTLAKQYAKGEPNLAKETEHYATHSREAAEALRNLAKIHQDLAKEHAKK
jgi:hypothetical protein